jgi:hypothetical protein
MDIAHHAEQTARAAWAEEIERAVENVKRTEWDKWMRREWHKAASRRQWSADRKARWENWRERRSSGVTRVEVGQPERVSVTTAKVWARGRVPHEFLDWVERHWAHDNETKAMLSECCFEMWERRGGNDARAGKATRPL